MSVLAFDLGASSGRAVTGLLNDRTLTIEEIHRFPNDPVPMFGHLHWDFLRLFREMKQGLLKSRKLGTRLQSVGIDSWGLDFGFIDRNGELIGNPYHYRDVHTNGMMERVFEIVNREELFARTGIQFMQVNSLYQLFALKLNRSSVLERAEHFLMIADLFRYFLTGEASAEYTNATTTQLLNPFSRSWDTELISRLGLPSHLFGKLTKPAVVSGSLLPSICNELTLPAIPVVAVGEHDTASAVAAVPADQDEFVYISCGTWSLMGTELDQPIINAESLACNFTNEGGIGGTYRFLKNIMGLWIIQECRRIWTMEKKELSYPEMVDAARKASPLQSFIDPDHPSFLHPEHMPSQIQHYCRETNQPVPQSEGEIVRCVLESLALKYRYVLDMTERLTGKTYPGLHLVGGGSQNRLLCEFTANAIGRPVWAGPAEASAIGNIIAQYMVLGKIRDLREARQLVKLSFPVDTYEPEETERWNEAYNRFKMRMDEHRDEQVHQ